MEPNHPLPPPSYYPPPPPQPPPEPPKKSWPARHKILTTVLVIVGFLFLVGGVTTAVGGESSTNTKTNEVAQPSMPPLSQEQKDANARASTEKIPPAPDVSAIPPVTAKAKPPPPIQYKNVTVRQWKLIAKNPDAHKGEHYVVYGAVTQFDSATGADIFRANVAGDRDPDGYYFEGINSVITGSETQLADIVEGDLFRAQVTILGSLDYDTQIGGSTTVPSLQLDSIKVTGSQP